MGITSVISGIVGGDEGNYPGTTYYNQVLNRYTGRPVRDRARSVQLYLISEGEDNRGNIDKGMPGVAKVPNLGCLIVM